MANKLIRWTTALTVKHFMTIYYILSVFIAISVNFITFPNFMIFYDFMTVCGSFAFIKEEHFGRTYIQLLFPRSFPGISHFSRSKIAFQKLPGVVATLGLGKVKFNELSSKYLQKCQKEMSSSVLLSQAGYFVPDSSFVPDRTFRVLKKSFCGGIRFFSQRIIRESFFELWIPIEDVYLKKIWLY